MGLTKETKNQSFPKVVKGDSSESPATSCSLSDQQKSFAVSYAKDILCAMITSENFKEECDGHLEDIWEKLTLKARELLQ